MRIDSYKPHHYASDPLTSQPVTTFEAGGSQGYQLFDDGRNVYIVRENGSANMSGDPREAPYMAIISSHGTSFLSGAQAAALAADLAAKADKLSAQGPRTVKDTKSAAA